MRHRSLALLVALLVLAAGCGQKAGVAQLTQGSDSTSSGASSSGGSGTAGAGTTTDEGTTGSGATSTGTTASGGGSASGARPRASTRTTSGGGASGTSAAGAEDRTGISATEIRIGIHAPITGAAAVSTFEAGVGVYSQFAGKIPGLGNRQTKVVYRDDKFDPSAARQACIDLVEKEKVFLLIGGAGADQIQACAQYAQSKGVPYFSPGVHEGAFTTLSTYFALSETYNQQNVQVGQLLKNQVKKTKLGIVLTDSPLLNETEANMKQQAQLNGLTVVDVVKLRKDANKTDTDSAVGRLNGKADVVYALISPTVFIYLVGSASQQAYFPTWVGPGLSLGVNLVAKAVCPQSPSIDARYLSPMVQMDKIDQHDKDYQPAYRQKNGGGSAPDDIGILLWGIEKTIRLLMESAGADLSRQSLTRALEGGKEFSNNVYAPVKYGKTPHFGADRTTLLKLNCQRLEYDTVAPFVSSL